MLWKNLLTTRWGARGDRPVSEPDLAEIWARSLNDLADMQIEPYQRAWLQLTRPLGLVENTALIATPNEFAKDQLENRLRALITNALSRELGRSIQLAVIIDPAVTATLPADDAASAPDPLGIRMPFGTIADRSLGPDAPLSLSEDARASAADDADFRDGLLQDEASSSSGEDDESRQAGFGVGHGTLPVQPGPAGLPGHPGHLGGPPGEGPDARNGQGLGAGLGAAGLAAERPGENGHQDRKSVV